tara:strand:- start:476 stop:694 length:219 start_codon:yes stop_codon:yes gene_type:complete
MKTLVLVFLPFLILGGCSTLSTTIDSGKKIGEAAIDDTISVAQTAISIPVKAVGTVVDKIEEEVEPLPEEDK